MKLRRTLGILYVLAAALGLLFCMYGLVLTWRARAGITQTATDNLVLLGDTLDTTRGGLEVVDQVLQTTAADLALVRTSVHTLTLAISDTNRIIDSLTTLTGTDLPATVSAAQTSLASAQASALLIDNMMAALASIPFLGLGAYESEVPLNVALGQVSASLDPLTPSLENISASLEGASANLAELENQLGAVAAAGDDVDRALRDAEAVIGEYQVLLAEFGTQVETARLAVPGWASAAAWILTGVFVSLLFAMIGLGERGMELARVREDALP